ncbi:RNA-directed DNA polymerase [Caballeronia novacaledonica]|uniref:reverse transcriptase domain-containing protein n=1 Tax=Caballeronia novacaledonica TaxID=1544861 RepID=UPI001EE1D73B|nr:reverse transcriptase domain-containing protein [Caballeronia novacaledonica]GJH07309.1 RNA-directed DNA polymerase [Caballeronia novacaledonica]
MSIADQLTENKVPLIFSLIHLAHVSGVKWSLLRSFVRRDSDFYGCYEIRKRSGGNRRICVPEPALKLIQKWIHANILRSTGALARLHSASTAYAPGASIKKNADSHVGAAWLIKLDIKDFFESISERQVYWVFRDLGYPALLSFELARLTTRVAPPRRDGTMRHRDKMWRWSNNASQAYPAYKPGRVTGNLPQGAPTSAMLSNLAVRELDVQIQLIAARHHATYTRYADDITLTLVQGSRPACAEIFRSVADAITHAGFRVNKCKSRISGPGSRKIITGLVITSKAARVAKNVRSEIEIALHYIKKHGLLDHIERCGHKNPVGYLNYLYGRIYFVRSIEFDFGTRALEELNALIKTYEGLGWSSKPFKIVRSDLVFHSAKK